MTEPIKLYSSPDRNVAGFSHEGISYTPDETGAFLVPEEALAVAFEHGLTTVVPEGVVPQEPPVPSLQERLDALKNKGDVAAFAKAEFGLDLDPDAMKRDEMEAAIIAKAAEE